MIILGIETSCDETAAALVHVERGRFRIVRNVVSSQIDIHTEYGGVVPEVAARTHVVRIIPVIARALGKQHPDLIAITAGPGLMSSLSVGVDTARALGYGWGVPVVATNHLAGHLAANLLSSVRGFQFSHRPQTGSRSRRENFKFPCVGLIVSGGHTELVFMRAHGRFELIGETQDDAAGEAFDKIATMLGLSYPGGPALSALAERGNPEAFDFPRGMEHSGDFNFSFSGLKTSVLYFLQKQKKRALPRMLPDIAASVQAAIVDIIVQKTVCAATEYGARTVLVGGGVAANTSLRSSLRRAINRIVPRPEFCVPRVALCTDNAAMIAVAGYFTHRRSGATQLDHLRPDPHLPLPR